jgi:hypothetical protein
MRNDCLDHGILLEPIDRELAVAAGSSSDNGEDHLDVVVGVA